MLFPSLTLQMYINKMYQEYDSELFVILRQGHSTSREIQAQIQAQILLFYWFQKRFVLRLIGQATIPAPKSGVVRHLYRVTMHQAFYLTMVSIIIIDMVNVAFSIVCQYHDDWKDKRNIFRSLNVMFVALYIMECVAKVTAFLQLLLKLNYWYVLGEIY